MRAGSEVHRRAGPPRREYSTYERSLSWTPRHRDTEGITRYLNVAFAFNIFFGVELTLASEGRTAASCSPIKVSRCLRVSVSSSEIRTETRLIEQSSRAS